MQGLLADPEGRLWVGRPAGGPGQGRRIDVLRSSGEYVGTIGEGALRFPDAIGPDGLTVWLETDALDVPVVTVGRLRLGSR